MGGQGTTDVVFFHVYLQDGVVVAVVVVVFVASVGSGGKAAHTTHPSG